MKRSVEQAAQALLHGGIAVIRTDTIYGVIAKADDASAVEKVYAAKHRDPSKQCIILISDASAAASMQETVQSITSSTERPTSIIVPAPTVPPWLMRGGTTMAYRVVSEPDVVELISLVGPVIAPSANPEGLPPARTINEAKAYFGDRVDVYVDGGEVPAEIPASRIVEVHEDGSIMVIREA